MCDYSLEHVASRPARIADRLVSTNFPYTLTGGFTASGDPNTAICLLPGTEIVFDTPPRYRTGFFFGKKVAPSTMARFRQINLTAPNAHHDALEFPNGTIVMLGDLFPKQWATIIQLPATAQPGEAVPHRPAVAQKTQVLEPTLR